MGHARLFTHLYHNTLMLSLITPISPLLGKLRFSLPIGITDTTFSTRVPSNMPSSLSSGQVSFRANRLYIGIYIIIVLGVSTTTSPGTVSPAIFNRALTHIELCRTLRGCCPELNLVVNHHQQR